MTTKIKKCLLATLAGTLVCATTFGLSAFADVSDKTLDDGALLGMSLSLKDDISANIKADVPTDATNVKMAVEYLDTTRYLTGQKDGEYTVFNYTGITAQHLENEMVMTLSYTLDGTEYYDTHTQSVQNYCESLFAKTATELGMSEGRLANMQLLVADLLKYGAAAQEYVGEEVTINQNVATLLADAGLTANATVVPTETDAKVEGELSADAYWTGAGVRFDYNVAMFFTFKTTVQNATVKAVKGDEAQTLSYTATENDGEYIAYYKNIKATELDAPVTVQIFDGATAVGQAFTYSVKSFVYNNSSMALAKAVYTYGQSAKTFGVANTLTVQGGNAQGKTVVDAYAGDAIDLTVTATAEEGLSAAGWYNVADRTFVSRDANQIVMPKGDLTIAPYFDGEYVDYSKNGQTGKLIMNNFLSDKLELSALTFQASSTVKPVITVGVVNGQAGRIYKADTVAQDTFCIPMTAYKVIPTEHTFEYTFENLGENAISFYLYMVNASKDAATVPATNKIEVSVQPGEVKVVEYTVSGLDNKNVLPVLYFTQTTENFKMGTYMYCTAAGAHECTNPCADCGKCKNYACIMVECEEKCECIQATKSVILKDGQDFFDGSNWLDFSDVARNPDDVIKNGKLTFTKNNYSRIKLFHTEPKGDGTYVHLFDKSDNITNNNAEKMFNDEYTYNFTINSTGEFDLLIGGANKSTAARNSTQAGSIYLNFALDGTVKIYHTSKYDTTKYQSWGELSGASTFDFSKENVITLKITRKSASELLVKIYVNGTQVVLEGTPANTLIKTQDGALYTNGVLNNTGFGQRAAFIPFNDTVVTINDFSWSYIEG